ncbi:MAG: HAD family phosphatase [Candidatus Bathyarchaeia archaeon]
MIRTIIFDLGGVYFKAGTAIAVQRIYGLVKAPKESVDEVFQAYPRKEGWLYGKGKLSEEEFWRRAVEKLGIDPKLVPELKEIWHSSYEPIEGMRELVRELRKRYRVIAFSGNVRERFEYLDKRYGLRGEFDDLVLSFEVGFHKDEREFYEALLRRIGCRPEECAFIDDKREFLDIAKSFGIKTIQFKDLERLKADLRGLGVEI